MAYLSRGMKNHLARLAGEHLVAAELCRRGMLATTFAGNLPDHDILAVRKSGRSVPVQVKTILNGGWQIGDSRTFVKIKFNGEHQKITGRVKLPRPNTLYVFVRLSSTSKDRFYICHARDVQDIVYRGYRHYLRRVGGRRPKNPKSTHSAIRSEALSRFENKWRTITG